MVFGRKTLRGMLREKYHESNFKSEVYTSLGTNSIHLHMAKRVRVGLDFTEAATGGVLGNFAKFTGKHLCQRLFFNKVFFPPWFSFTHIHDSRDRRGRGRVIPLYHFIHFTDT